jgi:hypothetical protein
MVFDDDMEAAATKIQAAFKGHKTRKELTTKEISNADSTSMDDDAKQAAFRKHHERIQELKDLKESVQPDTMQDLLDEDDVSNMIFDDEMEAAATKIQAAFKGHQTRKEITKKYQQDNVDGSIMDNILEPGQEESEIPVDEPIMVQAFVSRSQDGSANSKDESPDAIDIDPDQIQHDDDVSEIEFAPSLSQSKSNENERQSDEILEPNQGESDIPESPNSGDSQGIDEVDQPMIKDNSIDSNIKDELSATEENDKQSQEIINEEVPIDQCSEEALDNTNDVNEQILQVSDDQVETQEQEQEQNETNEDEGQNIDDEESTTEDQQEEVEEKTNDNDSESNQNDGDDPEAEECEPEGDENATGNRNDNLTDAEREEIENMVLDDEMEQAALKIQSTFRGHKTRKDCKEKSDATASGTEDIEKSVDELNIEDGNASNEAEKVNNDDDDVANMVLDEEMEQAALKIQSTFRGHKTRKEIKTKDEDNEPDQESDQNQEESTQPNDDDDVANMVLDEEMEQAALKIQSTFRGHKTRKEIKTKDEDNEPDQESDQNVEDEELEKPEVPEKTAQQLQDEEDIANLVLDDEMEQAALRIQSTFRGLKSKRAGKKETDNEFTGSSSAGDSLRQDSEEQQERSDESYPDEDKSIVRSIDQSLDRPESFSQRNSDNEAYRSGSERLSGEQSELESKLEESPELNFSKEGTLEDNQMLLSSGSGDDRSNRNSKDLPEDYDPFKSRNGGYESDNKPSSRDSEERVRSVNSRSKSKESNDSFGTKASINSAEAMYYSLKKEEMENQQLLSQELGSEEEENSLLGELENIGSTPRGRLSRAGMSLDERNLYKDKILGLSDSILSQEYPNKSKESSDEFDPFSQASKRKDDFLKQIHGRSEFEKSFDGASMDMGDEDQFDDFYPGNIRTKIRLDSVADSDYFDPKQILNPDDDVRTALETINSTDSDSTIISAATKIQASCRGYLTRKRLHSTGAGSTSQYASFGNAAINQSLDDFIER